MRQSTERKKVWRGLAPVPERYTYDSNGKLQALSFRDRQFLGLMRSFNDRQREAVRAGLDALNAGASQAEVKRIMEAGWKAA